MGTNYYLVFKENVCPTCGRAEHEDRLHIGKSSGGWCFSLHVTDEIRSLEDWKKKWEEGVIEDEYGDTIDKDDMIRKITDRAWNKQETPYGYLSWDHFHKQNGSVDGPNGLVRHAIDGRHCIGHGDGTWDLITGTFS